MNENRFPVETSPLLHDPAAARVERTAFEMRAGRPVVLAETEGAIAALALDATAPATFEAFATLAGPRLRLVLTPPRAATLGLDAPHGAEASLAGRSLEDGRLLGYGQDAAPPADWRPASAVALAAARLARRAALLPALAVMDANPADARLRDCLQLDLADLLHAEAGSTRSVEIVARSTVPLREFGNCEFVVFRGALPRRDQVAVVVGAPDLSRPVPVRVHSSCLTGDLFGSLKCDCGDQLRGAMAVLAKRGGGILLYLDQEGRDTGIAAKMRAYHLQSEGLDTIDADAELGFGADERSYEVAVAMLRLLGVASVELLTNNPAKVAALAAAGIEVAGRIGVMGEVTPENENYLRTKARRAGHAIDMSELD